MTKEFLLGFNYVDYLKCRHFIGRVHPWRKLEIDNTPMLALLVSLQNALDECIGWSGQEITRNEFLKYLKTNDVEIFNSPDDFVKTKASYENNQLRRKMNRMTPRLEEIINQLSISKGRAKYNTECERVVIQGKNGYIYEDEIDPSMMHVYVAGRSKRHFSSIKRKLSFMRLVKDQGTAGRFALVTGKNLLPEYAEAIRNALGLYKQRTITPQRKEALKKHAEAIREKIRPTVNERALVAA